MAKFSSLSEEPFDYGDRYFHNTISGPDRLVIGPSGSQVRLIDELAAEFETQRYFVLYVLLVGQSGRKPGRYTSPMLESHEELQLFIWTFQEFFEGDGRHHLWVACADSKDFLVYDQHDVIFAYGRLDAFERTITARGFMQEEFWFPSPHSHSYDPANIHVEDDLMAYFDWHHTVLQPGDEWD